MARTGTRGPPVTGSWSPPALVVAGVPAVVTDADGALLGRVLADGLPLGDADVDGQLHGPAGRGDHVCGVPRWNTQCQTGQSSPGF